MRFSWAIVLSAKSTAYSSKGVKTVALKEFANIPARACPARYSRRDIPEGILILLVSSGVSGGRISDMM